MDTFRKDPDALLDYDFDWSRWLLNGDVIASATATASTGLVVDHVTHESGMVTVWLAGGTKGKDYKVTVHVVTMLGREDDWSVMVEVRDR